MQYGFDPEELLSHKIIVDKLSAAQMQLHSAIKMFFYEWDVVSQHTLISAAHGILYDLAKKQGINGSIKDSKQIPSKKRKDFINAIHLPQNFFKHASSESGHKLEFRYKVSSFYLYDALRLFVLLGGDLTYPMKVFLLWFELSYPDLLCFHPVEEDLQTIRENITNPEDFKTLGRKLIQDAHS